LPARVKETIDFFQIVRGVLARVLPDFCNFLRFLMIKSFKKTKIIDELFVPVLVGLRKVLRILPAPITLWSTKFIACVGAPFFKEERDVAVSQLRHALVKNRGLKLNDRELNKLFIKNFCHVGRVVGEAFLIDRTLADCNKISENGEFKSIYCPNFHYLEQIRDSSKGTIGLTAHVGNFELLAAYLVKIGLPLSAVGREFNYPNLNEFLVNVRKSYGLETIWRKGGTSPSLILKAIRNGKAIGTLIDQDLNLENFYHPFFGLNAAYAIAPIKIAIRFNLPLFTGFMVREKDGRHRVLVEPVEYDINSKDAVEDVLRIYNSRLEEVITQYPEQWIWWHRRWRRRPKSEGQLIHNRNTYEYIEWLNHQSCKQK
jgi:Kdo2-lipid IVA lauroyltransferase/acyltransferase